MTLLRSAALAAGLGTAAAAGCAAQDRPGENALAPLAWLAGCWASRDGDRVQEEQWMAPAGGVMPGMARSLRDGRVTGWEHLRLVVDGEGRVVYHAEPSGQAPTDFPALRVAPGEAVFENPEHDFPTRLTYAAAPGDSLHVRVEGPGPDGALRGFQVRLARVACP